MSNDRPAFFSAPITTYFPELRSKMDVLREIDSKPELCETFYKWDSKRQEMFLDICTGARGLKVLSDGVFKEIFNSEITPERLEEFVSLLLKQKVKIQVVLPNDGGRLGDETTLIYTDILVELEDGTLCNVEIQKIGYAFPGARGACYSSDHLLRQYKKVRGERGRKFSYRDIKKVYTIVLFEKSDKEFHEFPDHYIHWFRQQSDTGLEMDMLQEYLYICLDIFKQKMENKDITTDLEAWMSFLSFDDPQRIAKIIAYDKKFKAMYQDMYELCLNTERVMQVISKELAILDRNTVLYMIDEMQAEIEEKTKVLKNSEEELQRNKEKLQKNNEELQRSTEELQKSTEELRKNTEELKKSEEELQRSTEELQKRNQELKEKDEIILRLQQELAALKNK